MFLVFLFKESLDFFVILIKPVLVFSQKTSSICTKGWGGSSALGTIYCLECIKELLHILSVCKRLNFISLFAQPGVLHVSEHSLYCVAYV